MMKKILTIMIIMLTIMVMGKDAEILAAEAGPDDEYTFETEGDYWLGIDGTKLVSYMGTPVDIVIPEGVTEIGGSVFQYCESLRSVVLPSTIKEIGYGAFDSCENLTSINLPEGLTVIKSGAFIRCKSLTDIEIPSTVTDDWHDGIF